MQNKYTLLEPLVHCKNQTEWAISRCDQVVCQCLFLCTLYDDSGPWLIIYWKTLLVHSLHLVRKIECINCSINHETIPHSLFILPKLYRIQKKHRVSHVIRKLIQTHREVSSENKRNYLKFTKIFLYPEVTLMVTTFQNNKFTELWLIMRLHILYQLVDSD